MYWYMFIYIYIYDICFSYIELHTIDKDLQIWSSFQEV